MPTKYRRSLATSVALFAAAIFAPSASAGVLVNTAAECASSTSMSQVFLPFYDPANYVVAPGGNLESTPAGWDLGGASIVAGNEPWNVGGASHSSSLLIENGESVLTQAMCVGIQHPTVRLFANQLSGSVLDEVDVSALFEDATGNVIEVPIGEARGAGWAPTPIMVLPAGLLAVLPDDRTAVAFRLTADGGDFKVDDLYVDPWSYR